MTSGAADIEYWYEKYLPLVLRRCRSMLRNDEDAFDAAQDVFLRALRAEGLSDEFPSALLYTIATRVCLNRLRWRARHGEMSGTFDETDFPAQDRAFEETEARLVLNEILKPVSEETRMMLYLYHVDGLTLEETGRILGMSASGVRKRLLKAQLQLQTAGIVPGTGKGERHA